MQRPALPANEADRLRSLAEYEILDTEAEPSFDALTRLVALGGRCQRLTFNTLRGLARVRTLRRAHSTNCAQFLPSFLLSSAPQVGRPAGQVEAGPQASSTVWVVSSR